jgi:hypothetical protein
LLADGLNERTHGGHERVGARRRSRYELSPTIKVAATPK